MSDLPKTGDVFDYPYLWEWQNERGETEGRKDRPCCTALVVPLKNGEHSIYLFPITTKQPTNDELNIEVPRIEVQRSGLSHDTRQWIILNEWNRDIIERSFYLADIEDKGSFSKKFTDQLLRMIKEMLQAGKITAITRD